MKRRINQQVVTKRRNGRPRVPLTVRLPDDLVKQIDRDLDGRAVPSSRNTWFFEAVVEKLRRNDAGDSHGAQ